MRSISPRVSGLRFLVSGFYLLVSPARAEITVGAAISLSDAVTEISTAYTAKTGGKVRLTFAGTNVISRQIEAGAPIDVFFSADTSHMDALITKGFIKRGTVHVVATNQLVVIAPADSKLTLKSARDLLSLDRIAIADPDSVPAGIYAKKWLTAEGVWEGLQIIPVQNVRAALIAAEAGDATAAIVYRSDALSSKKVNIALVADPAKTGAIEYPAAVVEDSVRQEEAKRFIEFLAGEAAGAVFIRHGFGKP